MEPGVQYIKLKKANHEMISIVGFHLYKVSRIVKFLEMENRMVAVRYCRGRKNGELFKEYGILVF